MNKRWVRVVFALLIGGAIQELYRVQTGIESRPLFFIGVIISYILLSVFMYYYNMSTLQKKVDREQRKNDELIDDLD